MLPQVWKIHY